MYYYYYYSNYDEDERLGLKFLHAAIDTIVNVHPRMSVSTIQMLLYIAGGQDFSTDRRINMTELGRQFNVPYSSLTRHIEILGEGSPGKKGLNLVERVNLPGQRKEQYVRLSDRGIRLIQDIKITFNNYRSTRSPSPAPRNDLQQEKQSVPRAVTRTPRPSDKTD